MIVNLQSSNLTAQILPSLVLNNSWTASFQTHYLTIVQAFPCFSQIASLLSPLKKYKDVSFPLIKITFEFASILP